MCSVFVVVAKFVQVEHARGHGICGVTFSGRKQEGIQDCSGTCSADSGKVLDSSKLIERYGQMELNS